VIDKPWKELFQRYARSENTYGKSKVIKIGGQLLGVLENPRSCSLVMDIVELALSINRCEEIKTVLQSQIPFDNIEEFKDLLKL
jgi:hypothetical protein